MATSKTKICNKAIAKIGGQLITNIDTDTSNEASWCNQLWDDVVDEVLVAHEWSFARYYKELSQDATDPAFEYDYRYSLPTTPYCLKVRSLYDTSADYKVHGRYIYTNAEEVYLIYTKRVTTVTEFSPLFINALSTLLAARVAGALDNPKMAMQLEVQYRNDLLWARMADTDGQSYNEDDEELWVDA